MALLPPKGPKKLALACLSALALIQIAQPAQAYYYNYYGVGNAIMWPLRALAYPLLMTPWSYRSPQYLGATMLQQGARAALRAPGYGSVPYFSNGQTIASQQLPLQIPQGPADQISYARWQKPTDLADREILSRAPMGVAPFSIPQESETVQGNIQQPSGQPILNAPPQAAPPQNLGYLQQLPPNAPPAPQPMPQGPAPTPLHHGEHMGGNVPLAAGFIDLINQKYDGDIGKALKNSDTRSWAHMLGLIDGKRFSTDLGSHRVETISRILKDQALDPVSKLDAIRILLRQEVASRSSKKG